MTETNGANKWMNRVKTFCTTLITMLTLMGMLSVPIRAGVDAYIKEAVESKMVTFECRITTLEAKMDKQTEKFEKMEKSFEKLYDAIVNKAVNG